MDNTSSASENNNLEKKAASRMSRWWDRLLGVEAGRYDISTIDTLKQRAIQAGLDPAFFDELMNLPCCPGSLGPGDPGQIGGCKPDCTEAKR